MTEFLFRIPEKNSKLIRLMNLFVLLVNLATYGYAYWISSANSNVNPIVPLLAGGICIFGLLTILIPHWVQKFSKNRSWILFLLLALSWFLMGYPVFGILMGVLTCFAWITARPSIIKINANGIEYPAFPVKKIAWNALTNMMLKDSVLTIDCKNNELIQIVIEPLADQEKTEISFNIYCKQALSKLGK